MKRSKSSRKWLQEHHSDHFVHKARAAGYRSRAAYKLIALQEKDRFLRPGMCVVDLGAAPGGWCQVAVDKVMPGGQVIACDLLKMDNLADVQFVQGDFTENEVLEALLALLPAQGVDVVLSDMAPNMTGSKSVDIPRAIYLVELAADFASQVLKPGGCLISKVFHGVGFDALVRLLREQYRNVSIRKPEASRSRSRETYLVAQGFQ